MIKTLRGSINIAKQWILSYDSGSIRGGGHRVLGHLGSAKPLSGEHLRDAAVMLVKPFLDSWIRFHKRSRAGFEVKHDRHKAEREYDGIIPPTRDVRISESKVDHTVEPDVDRPSRPEERNGIFFVIVVRPLASEVIQAAMVN